MSVEIAPKQPFRLDLTVWALRRVPVNEVDRWDGVCYKRVLEVDGEPVEVCVESVDGGEAPGRGDDLEVGGVSFGGDAWSHGAKPVGAAKRGDTKVRVTVTPDSGAASSDGTHDDRAVDMVSRALGMEVDLTPFYQLAAGDERLGFLASRFEGLKPPRFFTTFEGIVNGIACQQLSVLAGIHLLNRLCWAYGPRLRGAAGFPGPGVLAEADPESFRSLGFSRRKAESIISIAQAVVSGDLDLDGLFRLSDASVEGLLTQVKGIGRWTAQYVGLRGLGRLDVFPVDDVGGQNKVREWLALPVRPDAGQMERLLDPYKPYRGLIYFHLLLHQLAGAGSMEV